MLTYRQRQKIRRYIRAAIPVSLMAYALRVKEDAIRHEMGPELMTFRLEKLVALSQTLDEMALSQKSVTLSMAWFRTQLTQLQSDLLEPLSVESAKHLDTIPDVTSLSDSELHDEIHRLLTCDV